MPIGKKQPSQFQAPRKVDEVHAMILNSIRLSQRMKPGYVTLLVVAIFVGILWYAYPRGANQYANIEVPVIRAENKIFREAPVEEGGMDIPHQESTVFEPLEVVETEVVEKLLPAPEEPIARKNLPQKKSIVTDPEMNLKTVLAKLKEPEVIVTSNITPVQKPKVMAVAKGKPQTKNSAKVEAVQNKTQPIQKTILRPLKHGLRYIQLGAFRSEKAALMQWQKIKEEFGVLVYSLVKRVMTVDLGDKGIFYRLQAGAMTSIEGKEICSAINKKYKGSCILAPK